MLEAKLTPCATMLYHWILRKFPTSEQIKIDLQDFQAWTGEYLDNAYSDREIFEALQQLKQNHLVTVGHTEVTLGVRLSDPKTVAAQPALPILAEENRVSHQKSGDQPHPVLLIFLVMLTSFIFGSIPIAIGFSVERSPAPTDTTHISGKPETVLAEKQIQLSN